MPSTGDRNAETLSALEHDELRHRLRHHLQSMTSLINLQIRRAQHPETVRALEDLRARFGTITSIHVELDDATERPIAIDGLLGKFVRETAELYDPAGRHRLAIDIAPVTLSGQHAVILGQIMVELIINAYRHGLADRTGGTVRVELNVQGDQAVLVVADDGAGLRAADPDRTHFGFAIIASLARALGGSFEHEDRGGFVARVRFTLVEPVKLTERDAAHIPHTRN